MKPTFVVMLILLVGGLVIAPMYVKGPTGDPIMTAEDWVPDPVKDVAEAVKPTNQAYRWKDAEGVWQFSDTKPAGVDDQDVQKALYDQRELLSSSTPTEHPQVSVILRG